MGKTYALHCFVNGLNPNQCQTAYISLSTISVTEFYREFCTLLGLKASGNKTGMFRAIQERVYYLYREKKKLLVLVGKPYLNHILDKQVHESLRQRITVHHNYEGLSEQEVPDYISHKLELAGRKP